MTDRHAAEHLFLLASTFKLVESRFDEVSRCRIREVGSGRREKAYTYAILRFESSEQRCSHCSILSSPLVSLNTPKGLKRTPTRPDPMAEHNLSTVSSVNRHLLVTDPPYSSLRWFTTFQLLPQRSEAYHYCGGTGQTNTCVLALTRAIHIPISCVNLNPITTRRYRVDCGLHKVLLGSRDILTRHCFRRFEWKRRERWTRQETAQAHRTTTLG